MQKGPVRAVAWWLTFATVIAMTLIAWGALFLIAPVWQLPDVAAAYVPPNLTDTTVSSETCAEAPIDVNLADAETLQLLPGIGPAKAAAILAYREEHGPFSSLAELEKVSGISARMVESWSGLAVAGTDNR